MSFNGLSNQNVATFVYGQKRQGQRGCSLNERDEMLKAESLMFVGVTAVSAETRLLSSQSLYDKKV